MSNIHRRTFHLWIGEPHLQMKIIHTANKITEASTSGFDKSIITKMAEESDKTATKEPHKLIFRCNISSDISTSSSQTWNQMIRIDLMSVEDSIF